MTEIRKDTGSAAKTAGGLAAPYPGRAGGAPDRASGDGAPLRGRATGPQGSSRQPVRKPKGAPAGVKALVTAAAMAATLGGWAIIGATDTSARTTPDPPTAVAQVARPRAVAPTSQQRRRQAPTANPFGSQPAAPPSGVGPSLGSGSPSSSGAFQPPAPMQRPVPLARTRSSR